MRRREAAAMKLQDTSGERIISNNPLPPDLRLTWARFPYINIIWN